MTETGEKVISWLLFMRPRGSLGMIKHKNSMCYFSKMTLILVKVMAGYQVTSVSLKSDQSLMMSSNGNIFHVTLCVGKSSVTSEFPSQRPVMRSCDVFLDLQPNKCLSFNNRDAGELRCHRTHYDVTVMTARLFASLCYIMGHYLRGCAMVCLSWELFRKITVIYIKVSY